jgi:hypothetical protein
LFSCRRRAFSASSSYTRWAAEEDDDDDGGIHWWWDLSARAIWSLLTVSSSYDQRCTDEHVLRDDETRQKKGS